MKKTVTPLFTLLVLGFIIANTATAQEVLYAEEFNYAAGELPPGWIIDADQPPSWGVNISQISGGVAPELYLGYGFQVGLSRLVSSPIAIAGHEKLSLRYKQYLINYAADAGEEIGLDVTFDGGTTWQALWEAPLWLMNIPQDEYIYYFSAPTGATEMQFAFRFEGNNNFINGWAIDDIVIESVIDNDLVARKIIGNTTPNIGEVATYTVEVQNGGKETQSNFTIVLKNENDDEVASAQGSAIDFSETISYTLTWTPTAAQLGNHTLYAVVESNTDENLNNNQTTNLIVDVQLPDTEEIQIGTETYPSDETPFNFFYRYSLVQTLYLADQINTSQDFMTGIQYTGYFDEDTVDVPISIYLAETTQNNLENAWVDPSTFTLVYEGTIDFQKGLNNIFIPFDTNFEYTGNNLVVYTNKSFPEQVLWVGFLNTPNVNEFRSRVMYGDDQVFDAMNPPNGYARFQIPNVSLFFSSGTMSVIDNEYHSNVVLYPNPVTDILNIQTSEDLREIWVINSLGQQVLKRQVIEKTNSLDLQGLQSGFYLIQIVTDKGIVTRKIQVK